jgi:hypothetical protein
VRGQKVLLVDDVMTTGASLFALAQVMRDGGRRCRWPPSCWPAPRTPDVPHRPGRPEIPPNTGNVIRLAANTGCALHLVEPLGFSMEDR